MLCVDQFAWTQRTNSEMLNFKKKFMHQLHDKVGEVGRTLLVLEKWNDLMGTLKQIWVVWELFSTLDAKEKASMHVLFSEEEHGRFLRDGLSGVKFSDIQQSLDDIDANEARAWKEEDKDLILGIMEETGVHNVNSRVPGLMRQWLVQTGLLAHKHASEGQHSPWLTNNLGLLCENLGDYALAEKLYRCRLSTEDKQLRVALLNNLATTLHVTGRSNEAESFLKEALKDMNEDDVVLRLQTMNNMALVQRDRGDLLRAEKIFRLVLEERIQINGARHQDSLQSMSNLGNLLRMRGELSLAEPLCREALVGMQEVLTSNHVDTLSAMTNLANVLLQLKRPIAEIEPLRQCALEGCWQQLGRLHPTTLKATLCMAMLYFEKRSYSSALPLYLDAVEGSRKVLGDGHGDTLMALYNMSLILATLGEYHRALPLCEEAYNGFWRIHGRYHPYTRQASDVL